MVAASTWLRTDTFVRVKARAAHPGTVVFPKRGERAPPVSVETSLDVYEERDSGSRENGIWNLTGFAIAMK